HGQLTAASKIWTEAEIQLCYWHVIRAIKKKLSSTSIVHNNYSSYEAHSLCSFIDPTWQTLRQNQVIVDHTNQEQMSNEKDKVMEENPFADLPENLHFAYENLNYNYYTHKATAYNDDPQVDIDNQESIDIVS
ncbi:14714_t:CDS:2, partial [Cetraspora pellucida]